jgi:hypothetical protein
MRLLAEEFNICSAWTLLEPIIAIPIRRADIAITTNSSIKVKPSSIYKSYLKKIYDTKFSTYTLKIIYNIVLEDKKGAKGMDELSFLLLLSISIIPNKDPVKKAKNKTYKTAGYPNKSPIKKTNFISPPPIPDPLVISMIKRKIAESIIAITI